MAGYTGKAHLFLHDHNFFDYGFPYSKTEQPHSTSKYEYWDIPANVGTIQLWSGSVASIPAGWVLCDGENGSPDLRNKFIIGSGDTYAVGDKAGSINHSHDFTGIGHRHPIPGGPDFKMGWNIVFETDIDPITGTTDAKDGRPPYYSLAYIMYAAHNMISVANPAGGLKCQVKFSP